MLRSNTNSNPTNTDRVEIRVIFSLLQCLNERNHGTVEEGKKSIVPPEKPCFHSNKRGDWAKDHGLYRTG